MVNSMIIIVSTIFVYIEPICAELPKNPIDDTPLPLTTIEAMYGKETENEIKKEVDETMWKFGMDELEQYCQFLLGQHEGKFKAECTKVGEIYIKQFKNQKFDYPVDGKKISRKTTIRLETYLQKIAENIENENLIVHGLKESILSSGWYQMRFTCTYVSPWNQKSMCKLVKNVHPPEDTWNPNPSSPRKIHQKMK